MAWGYVHFCSVVIIELSLNNAVDGIISCTFDDGFCGWHNAQGSYILWRNNSGQTADRTSGPLYDHTLKNITGQYVFMSGIDIKNEEDTAVLESEPIFLPMATVFSFWYLMNGYGTGTLILEQHEGNHTIEVWKKSGQQNKDWCCDVVELKAGSNFTLRFKAIVHKPIGSDVALDDMQLHSESQDLNTVCGLTTRVTTTAKDTISSIRQATTKHTLTTGLPTTTANLTSTRQASTEDIIYSSTKEALNTTSVECVATLSNMTLLPGTCDFERDFCKMTVIPDHSNPNVTWARTNKMDGDRNKIEDNIHGNLTFLNSNVTRGFYAHFVNDESSNALPHEIANIETPEIRSHHVCLTFWYLFPTNESNLVVLLNDVQGNSRQIWAMDNMKHKGTMVNLQTKWFPASITIKESSSFKIIFQTVHSDRSTRVGIDDIEIIGVNTEKSTFTTTNFTSSVKTSTEVFSSFSTTKLKLSTKVPTTQQAVENKPTADEAADHKETAKIIGSGISLVLVIILIIIMTCLIANAKKKMTYFIVNANKSKHEITDKHYVSSADKHFVSSADKHYVSSAENTKNKDIAIRNNENVYSNINISRTGPLQVPHKARIYQNKIYGHVFMNTNDVPTNATN